MIDRLFTNADPKPKCHWSPPPDDDIHQFYELLDEIDRPANTQDYKVPQEPVKPTQSVVEVHQPRDLAAPDPEVYIVANSLHLSGAAETAQVKEKEAVSQN